MVLAFGGKVPRYDGVVRPKPVRTTCEQMVSRFRMQGDGLMERRHSPFLTGNAFAVTTAFSLIVRSTP